MGNQTSTQTAASVFNQTVSNYLSTTFINISRTNQSVISGSQSINISNLKCGGNLVISGITQKAVSTINTQALSQIVNSSQLQNILTSAVTQGANAIQNASSGSLATANISQSDITALTNSNISNVAQSYKYSDFQADLSNINQIQSTNISGLVVAGECNISNISQDMVLENLAKTITDRLTQQVTDIANSTTLGQTSSSQQSAATTGVFQDLGSMFSDIGNIFTGPVKTFIIAAAVVLLFIVILLIAWRSSGSSEPEQQMLPPLQTEMYAQPNPYMRPYQA